MNNDKTNKVEILTSASPKRAVIYARVSTDEQAEHGYSLPSQTAACKRYAEQHGFTVVAEYEDDYTGASLDRPKFALVREMIRLGKVDVLIVYCADRLTRNLAHSLILRDEFERAGVERHYAMRGRAENTPENRMLENIEGVFAEYEREKIRERMTRASGKRLSTASLLAMAKFPMAIAARVTPFTSMNLKPRLCD
ncbi:MAG: recombinase family protein [Anaerolineae bacterium]|nr:recombinase family protein [Anaerolineae bacterium]